MDISPGPGWTKGKDGEFHPHYFVYDHFPSARLVAGVFKVLAALVIISGAVAAFESARGLHSTGTSNGIVIAVVAGIIGGTIIAASAMAFFGYVLQLLVAIHFDVRNVESSKLAEDLR
jgi:ABC-type polysaccharide/polyol phosphate export permease